MKIRSNKKSKKENGQIIVLLAVSLVVVMVVAALAVDGGMIYSERRFAQNASDAASLAGAGTVLNFMEKLNEDDERTITAENLDCDSTLVAGLIYEAKEAAIRNAELNLITNLPYLGKILDNVPYPEKDPDTGEDYDLNANHGVVIKCVTHQYIDTQVRITSSVSTAFAHLVYPGDLVTTNEAVTRSVPRHNFGFGNGLVSLSPDCWAEDKEDGGTEMDGLGGSGQIVVESGGIHTNSCYMVSGSSAQLSVSATNGITSVDENAYLSPSHGDFSYTGGVDALNIQYPTEPTCSANISTPTTSEGTTTYTPGTYEGVSITGNNDVIFEPGVYCIQGDFTISGSGGNKKDPVIVKGDGVTFFIQKADGSNQPSNVSISGDKHVLLTARKVIGEELYGFLFFMDDDNIGNNKRGEIKITGNSSSYYSGTVYAPTGTINVGGSSIINDPDVCEFVENTETCQATVFTTQFIGYDVKVHGSGQFVILYDSGGLAYVDGMFFLEK